MGNPQDYEEVQPKWPHLENHYKVNDFFQRATWITVTEKIHGFNARFGRTESGLFWVGSRNNVVWEGVNPETVPIAETLHKDATLQGFTLFAASRAEHVEPGYTYFGEWAGPGIQKGIDYGPEQRFFLFAVSKAGDRQEPLRLLPWPDVTRHAFFCDLEMVPTLYDGLTREFNLAWLETWASDISDVSDDPREGICITAWPPLYEEHGHMLILKWKNPAFAERASMHKPKAERPDLSNVQAFVDDYATMERLKHVIDQVTERLGQPAWHPEYTGDVLRTYYDDVLREGSDDVERLSEDERKQIGKVLNRAVKPLLDEYRNRQVTMT